MSCPTCDATLAGIGHGMWHCERCGTLVGCPLPECVHVPALVRRCRAFGETLAASGALIYKHELRREWRTLGVQESIDPPEAREKDGGTP